MKNYQHTPVLKDEVVEGLRIEPENKYIDATLGGGGHAMEILEKGGLVLGIDQDQEAIEFVKGNLESRINNQELKLVKGNFRDVGRIARENGFEQSSGVLFDLGVSSYQLDSDKRGFSIKRDAPLDMRMDRNLEITAADIVNSYSEENLVDIFQRYGEEERAKEAAAQIVKSRKVKKIETTEDLVIVIALALKKRGIMHPATKVFQALRIEVNSELEALKQGLKEALEVIKEKGRIGAISFHSLEDRIVKQAFDNWEEKGLGIIITKKPIVAQYDEVRSNPRARSAKLRIFEKKI
jgi:16S rRNA (cytosine1402-N4)-methyltransferase